MPTVPLGKQEDKRAWSSFAGRYAAMSGAVGLSLGVGGHLVSRIPSTPSLQQPTTMWDVSQWTRQHAPNVRQVGQGVSTHLANYNFVPGFKEGSFFNKLIMGNTSDIVNVGSTPDIPYSLHEIGHARSPVGMKPYLASRKIAPLFALGSAGYFVNKYSKTRDQDNVKLSGTDLAVGLAPMAAYAPMLAEEAQASGWALNFMRKNKMPGLGKAAAKLAAGWGTYGMMAAGSLVPMAAYALASKLSRGVKEDHNTIEGMGEGGLAAKLRKENTDFGSGYKGLLDPENPEYQDKLSGRFNYFAHALEKYGQETGTGHKRIIIPKSIVSEQDLEEGLGFQEVLIGIPEAGQTRFTSWRHADNLFHLHEHKDVWTMHKDEHASYTMILDKWRREQDRQRNEKKAEGKEDFFSFRRDVYEPTKNLISGIPHIITEGVPGLYYYLKGQAAGVEDLAVRVASQLPNEFKQQLQRATKKKSEVFEYARRKYGDVSDVLKKQEAGDWTDAMWNAKFAAIALSAPAYVAAKSRAPEAVMKSWYGKHLGRAVSYTPTLAFLGIEAARLGSDDDATGSLIAGVTSMGVTMGSSKRFDPMLSKIKHVGARSGIKQGMYLASYLAGKIAYNVVTGASSDYSLLDLPMPGGILSLPEENEAYNPDNGLPKQGMARNIIKTLTPFGSKVDRLKKIAQMMGQSLDEVRSSKAFHEALSQGRHVKELGSGAWGKVDLLETELAGHKLFFARKTSTRTTRDEIMAEASMRFNKEKQMMGKLSGLSEEEIAQRARVKSIGYMKSQVKEHSLRREASVMEKVGHEGIVPTPYSSRLDELNMEAAGHLDDMGYFHPAETFRKSFGTRTATPRMKQALESHTVDPRRMLGQMERQAMNAKSKGIINRDIHDEQFLLSPETGDIWWTDWGLGSTGKEARSLLSQPDVFKSHVLGELKKETHNAAVVIQDWRRQDLTMKSVDDYADLMLKDIREAAPPAASPQLIQAKTGQARGLAAAKRQQQAAAQKTAQATMWNNATGGGKRHNNAYDRRLRRSRNPFDTR